MSSDQAGQTDETGQTGGADAAAGLAEAADGLDPDDLLSAADKLEELLLGEAPSLTRREVAERAEVGLEMSEQLWRLLGFAHVGDDDVAFTPADVEALRLSRRLSSAGVVDADSQAALVRTWGRSFARLADWQTTLLAGLAVDRGEENGGDAIGSMTDLADHVLPDIDRLQSYVWRRHLASAGNRLLTTAAQGSTGTLAVCFVDIVGYTAQSRSLEQSELVEWIEYFEDQCAGMATDAGGRVIKNIGDEVLLVAEDTAAAADLALAMTARGQDDDDRFPAVRAGVAHGDVVSRLGDVFGPTVNVASRLTSAARPGTVLVDQGCHDLLCDRHPEPDQGPSAGTGTGSAYRLKRVRRLSVKGYSRLPAWVLRARD